VLIESSVMIQSDSHYILTLHCTPALYTETQCIYRYCALIVRARQNCGENRLSRFGMHFNWRILIVTVQNSLRDLPRKLFVLLFWKNALYANLAYHDYALRLHKHVGIDNRDKCASTLIELRDKSWRKEVMKRIEGFSWFNNRASESERAFL